MIDVHAAVVAIHDANLTGGKQAAIRATTEVLADCWDDCADANNLGDRNTATNPYRLALEMTNLIVPDVRLMQVLELAEGKPRS